MLDGVSQEQLWLIYTNVCVNAQIVTLLHLGRCWGHGRASESLVSFTGKMTCTIKITPRFQMYIRQKA